MSSIISVRDVIVPKRYRGLKPHNLARISASMQDHGYNPSYPITITEDKTLVDGRHRLEAARQCGIEEVPYVLKPTGVLPLAHSVRCNLDQTLGTPDDLFDLAEYCWGYAQDGWLREQIGEALNISSEQVTYYKNIREKLHPKAWNLAVTRNQDSVIRQGEKLVTREVTIVTWKETHFRSLLKYLPWQSDDHATYRAQMQVIRGALARFSNDSEKVTAVWIEELASSHAWVIKLKRYAIENLKPWVKLKARKGLFRNINGGIFGKQENEDSWARFQKAIDGLNGKMPRLIVGKAEAMIEIDDESVDVIITSPPYNLGADNWPMGGQGRQPRENGIGYQDERSEDEYQQWQIECLKEMYRVAKPGASLFYNHKVRQKEGQMIHPLDWLRSPDNPWILRQEIIWDRTSTHNHCPVYFWPHDERIYWMTKGEPILGNMWYKGDEEPEDQKRSTVWRFHGPKPGTWHPAPFPEELPRRCLQAIGRENITVLDPFAGSCTTIKVAIEEFGFDAIGIDVLGEYIERAKRENGWMNESET